MNEAVLEEIKDIVRANANLISKEEWVELVEFIINYVDCEDKILEKFECADGDEIDALAEQLEICEEELEKCREKIK